MPLTQIRFESFEERDGSGTRYGLRFTKFRKSYELFADSLETHSLWISYLRTICILTDFHNMYSVKKLIGSENSEKVILYS